MGTSGTAVDFRDSNRTIFIRNTRRVSAGFNAFDIQNASSRVDWTNISISALGTQSRGTFTVTDNADVNFDSCTFTDMNTFGFLANSAVIDSTFRRCNEITAPGSVFTGTLIATPTVAADSYALRWNPSTAQDTNGYLDNMAFTKGTNAHHAIRFSTYKASHDLIGISFSGFNASNAQNDSTLYFDDTGSDVTWTINLIGCSGNISYKKARAGDTVTLVSDPVALAVHVQDSITGTAISGARVWAAVTSTAGGRYYNTSVSSITQTGGTATATVADTSSLVTGNYVWIQGAGVEAYNGTKQITVTGGTTFTFAIDSGTASPAGGTITATFVVINGTTDGSGNISGTFSWSASQPITGRVRDADGTPFYYKTGPFSGTIDSANGLAVTVQMIRDE